jgi:hypothetical protein
LAWIDEVDGETPSAVRLVAMTADGEQVTSVRRIGFGGSHLTSLAMTCDGKRCRGLVSGYDDTLHLGVFETARASGAPLRAEHLASLAGGSDQDMSLSATDTSLSRVLFTRDVPGGAEVRQLSLSW